MTLPAISIIDAVQSPTLFGPLFGGPTWGRWRAFLAALFGLPMNDEALAFYRHHTERQTPPAAPFREAALIVGRRGAKSRILGLIACYLAAFVDYTGCVAPGEQPVIAIIAADRRQARVLLRYVAAILRAVPALASMIDGEPLAESVALTNGVVIEIHTGSIGAPRGRTFAAVLADEIAFWRSDDAAANPDAEVIAAVRPGLGTIPTAMLVMASSPYAKRGVLWRTFRQNFGKDGARVLVWRGTTAEMNPTLDPEIIAEAREADPAAAAAEYDAQFRDDIAAFVPREVVEVCVVAGRVELPPVSGVHYVGRVDPSGGSSDSFTLAIAHRERDGTVVLDAVRERRPPFSPEGVAAEFAGTLKAYRIARVVGDRYAGEWPREQFRKHGVEYVVGDKSASELYVEFLPLLNSGKVELLDNARLIAQLCGLERRTARAGRDSIDHSPGGHDDVSNAVAGAMVHVAMVARSAFDRLTSGDWSTILAQVSAPLGERAAAQLARATDPHRRYR